MHPRPILTQASYFRYVQSRVKRVLPVVLLLFAIACSSTPKPTAKKAEPEEVVPTPVASSSSSAPPRRDCIIVQDENPVPVRVVGVLVKAAAASGASTDAPFLLRLSEPRCVIGLPRASFVREVYVATAGPDLRPLVDRKLLIEGNAIGGLSDMGGPAVIVLAKNIENAFGSDGTTPAP
jgi:hypothetical protein